MDLLELIKNAGKKKSKIPKDENVEIVRTYLLPFKIDKNTRNKNGVAYDDLIKAAGELQDNSFFADLVSRYLGKMTTGSFLLNENNEFVFFPSGDLFVDPLVDRTAKDMIIFMQSMRNSWPSIFVYRKNDKEDAKVRFAKIEEIYENHFVGVTHEGYRSFNFHKMKPMSLMGNFDESFFMTALQVKKLDDVRNFVGVIDLTKVEQ